MAGVGGPETAPTRRCSRIRREQKRSTPASLAAQISGYWGLRGGVGNAGDEVVGPPQAGIRLAWSVTSAPTTTHSLRAPAVMQPLFLVLAARHPRTTPFRPARPGAREPGRRNAAGRISSSTQALPAVPVAPKTVTVLVMFVSPRTVTPRCECLFCLRNPAQMARFSKVQSSTYACTTTSVQERMDSTREGGPALNSRQFCLTLFSLARRPVMSTAHRHRQGSGHASQGGGSSISASNPGRRSPSTNSPGGRIEVRRPDRQAGSPTRSAS